MRGSKIAAGNACPVCETGTSALHARIDGYDYFRCAACGSLHIDSATLDMIDAGNSTRIYDEGYWREELQSARERAIGESLVRAGEAILYARRPVRRFLDIGAGPGFLLDELARQFPRSAEIFHGVEMFPPEQHSTHPNYLVGEVGDLRETFDAGVCIEVIEHLTPRMLERLVDSLARISEPDSLWLFNTSLAERTLMEDPGYLDPLHRGHIVSWSLAGLRRIFEPHGFRLRAVPGKNYAFVAEFRPRAHADDFERRIYHPLPENKALLEESRLLYQAAFESARATLYHARCLAWPGDAAHGSPAVQAELERMLHSRSWRLTRPLRVMAAWLRRERTPAVAAAEHVAGRRNDDPAHHGRH